MLNEMDPSLESIARQSGELFRELTNCIIHLRQTMDFSNDGIKKSLILPTIKRLTGLKINLKIIGGDDAYVVLPRLTPAHVFDRYGMPEYTSKGYLALDVARKDLIGSIDPVKGKVGGVFSDIDIPIRIGFDYFRKDELTPEEVAAILIHELGHAFTYFQYLTHVGVGSLLISKAAEEMMKPSSTLNERKIVLKRLTDSLGIEYNEAMTEIVSAPKEGVEEILITACYTAMSTLSGNPYYDFRNCEQLADTFAVRHGAGLANVTGLHKYYSQNNRYGHRSKMAHIFSSLLIMHKFSSRALAAGLILERYDRPDHRYEYIKRQLIDDLKKLDKSDTETRKDITNQIATIDEILKSITYRRHVFNYIYETFNKNGKYLLASRDAMKELETMVYNDLYYKSAQFRNLK